MATESVKQSTLSGIRWLALRSLVGEFTQIACTVVLARLVSPSEFGHAAVALLFIPLATILTFEGFASALVQRESYDEDHRRVSVLMSLTAGLCLSVLLYASVPFVWRPIFGTETGNLVALASPVFIIASAGTVSRATLWRRLDFRKTTIIDVTSALLGNIVAVVLAADGLGARALVIGSLAWILFGTLFMFVAAPEPLPRWHGRSAREIVKFGLPSALAGLVGVMFQNVDYWIVAARLSAFKTGIYYRAFNIGVVYQGKVSSVMMQLAFPVYSRVGNRDEMRSLHERAARIHAAIIFPFLASLIALAPLAVPFAFGAVWTPAVVPSQLMAGAGMIAAVLTGYPQVMLAVGRPRVLLYFNLVVLLTYATAIAIAASWGLIAVAIAAVCVYTLILLAVYRFLLGPYLGIPIRRLIPDLGAALAGCAALIAAEVPLRMLLSPEVAPVFTITIVGLVGLVVYTVVLRVAFRSTFDDVVALAVRVAPPLSRLQRRPRATTPPSPPRTPASPAPAASVPVDA